MFLRSLFLQMRCIMTQNRRFNELNVGEQRDKCEIILIHEKEFKKNMGMEYFCWQEERRRTGRYVAGGTALAVTLLGLHHLLLRGASTIAGVCVPAIIMALYIIWVLYSARRDRRKVVRFEMFCYFYYFPSFSLYPFLSFSFPLSLF